MKVVVVLGTLLVAVYTLNYARWAWRRQLRFGAAGLVLLAVATVAVPAWIMWFLN
ncbi:hypothetical protein [Symbiobacterium thermophilum]|uniref:Uncharacterized protein n=2 Tax=Symbiobacterium thermophilum TaxID=2734 RepID=Q67LK6_SYMTH|nr:hypothetical protein [Symbiobacterium thermophilum]BAD41440.1 hypothetical protein STH2455 [Symbiobacterium thermophilum IAM 14863]